MSSPPPPVLPPPGADPLADPLADPPHPHPPGRTAVWVIGCACAAALTLLSGLWLTFLVQDGRRSFNYPYRTRDPLNEETLWGVLAGLAAFAGWQAWRTRDRLAAVREPAGAVARWACAGAAAYWGAAIGQAVRGQVEPVGELTFAVFLTGPACGALLWAWVAAACGPPVYRRPLAQTAGWVGGCVLAALLTFGPALFLTLLEGTAVGGVPTLLVAGGGTLFVLVAAITAAVLWRHSELAQERFTRWGQIGFVAFAAATALLSPLLARFLGEATSREEHLAYFFTAFVALPALGCGAAALAGRWALRQAPDAAPESPTFA
ncbi:hypothetical protein [Alienimonas sp. DA493]|uniref:hypothetical protein n=1 Tax=Alienimonas sp. DA493 TaxID=3373605 RepID=UPI0037547029